MILKFSVIELFWEIVGEDREFFKRFCNINRIAGGGFGERKAE